MFFENLISHVEALLFASGEPLTSNKIAKILDISSENVEDIIFDLKEEYKKPIHGITIRTVAGGYQIATKEELYDTVAKLALVKEQKIPPATMETLAIIAFKQPVTKQEIEFIRGVRCDRVINFLLDLKLIKEAGRKKAIGRPILYETTEDFLITFGMNSLLDLPKIPESIFNERINKNFETEEDREQHD